MSVLDRSQVFKEEFWAPLMTPEEKEDFEPQSSFCFCVVTKEGNPLYLVCSHLGFLLCVSVCVSQLFTQLGSFVTFSLFLEE